MDELLWRLRGRECKVVAYADDLLLIAEGQSRVELERMGTEWMGIVCNWSLEVGVSVSESKTVCMLMKGTMSSTRHPIACANIKRVRYASYVKYLGVWMSERMSFKLHLECLRKRCVNVVGLLRRVMKRDWGLRKRALMIIYRGLFSAGVMYGASVWYDVMQFQYARVAINKCQRVILSACSRVCRTVSTEAMQVLMGGLPWDLECVRKKVCTRIRNDWRLNEWDIVSDCEVRDLGVDECVKVVSARLYDVWQRR